MNALYRLEHADRLLMMKDLKIRAVAVGQPRELLDHAHRGRLCPAGRDAAKPEARAAATSEGTRSCPDASSP